MSVDIRVTAVKPIRNTFAHLARRFGDKPATRYQEIAYDTQPEANLHYRPLWDPEREIYDKRRTAIVMKDWYALKDPRQFYYASYTTTRAKQQDAVDRQLEFVEKRELLRQLPEAVRDALLHCLLPLRHYEWGANTTNSQVSAYGWGTTITQAAMMCTADRLGMAQHLSRIGLMLDGNTGDALTQARQLWVADAVWQPLRAEVEHLMATRDWFEVLLAQDLVADGLIYPLMYQHFDARIAAQHGAVLSSLTDYLLRWYEETARWVDAVIKTAATESPENREQLSHWYRSWRDRFVAALRPLADAALGDQSESALQAVMAALQSRAIKLGLSV